MSVEVSRHLARGLLAASGFRRFTMALKQLSAGIMVGVFALTAIGIELGATIDREIAEIRAEVRSDAGLIKSRKDEKQSPWETRQMIPAGPKY
jgi:hypothetical protein